MCRACKSIKKRWHATPRRVKFWLVGGVLPTIAALALLVFGDMWVGYTLAQAASNHFLDFCLTTFTLAVSIFSSAVDIERQINRDKRMAVIGASVGLGFLCAIIFCFLYYRNLLIEKGIEDMTPPSLLCGAHVIFIIVALLVVRTGIMLEKETTSQSIQPKPEQPVS